MSHKSSPSLFLAAALAVALRSIAINPAASEPIGLQPDKSRSIAVYPDLSPGPEAPGLGNGIRPEKGQLVFVAGGDSDFSRAITSATALPDGIAFDHVGIIDVDSTGVWVVEASPREGVTITPWSDFAASSPRLMVVRVNDSIDAAGAVERAKEYVGRPYDWAYAPGPDSIYCSELVQLAYLDAEGKPVFESRPMNFLDENGVMPEFWTRLFEKLGVPVPQGVPGTNPNDMARDALRLQ